MMDYDVSESDFDIILSKWKIDF